MNTILILLLVFIQILTIDSINTYNILAFGDSLTYGLVIINGTYSLHPYTIQFNKNVNKNNLTGQLYAYQSGIGGETTADMLMRLPDTLRQYTPTVVSILCGTNDLIQRTINDNDYYYSVANITARIEQLHLQALAVSNYTVAMTLPDSPLYDWIDAREEYDLINDFIRRLSANHARIFLLDLEDSFDYLIPSNSIYWSSDTIHLSYIGYNRIGQKLFWIVSRIILHLMPPINQPSIYPAIGATIAAAGSLVRAAANRRTTKRMKRG